MDDRNEHAEAVDFAKWLTEGGYLFTHVVNEMPGRTVGFGWINKLRSEGWKAGTPDYIVCHAGKLVFVELKKQRGPNGGGNGSVVSPEQEAWIAALQPVPGVHAAVCHGAEEAKVFTAKALDVPY